MKDKKSVSLMTVLLFWTCAVVWSVNVGLHFHHGSFDLASKRVIPDIACALLWIAAAIIQTISYRRRK